MTVYDQIVELTSHITLIEKARLLEYLSTTLKTDIETEAFRRMPWEQFMDQTYGSLAGEPIERNQPPRPDERDEIE